MRQTAAQRKEVAAEAVRLSPPGKQAIVHVGAMSTAQTIDLAERAERNYSLAEIRAYYSAASGLPVFIYYFPSLAPAIDPGKMAAVRKTGAIIYNGSDQLLVAGLLRGADGGIGGFLQHCAGDVREVVPPPLRMIASTC